MEIKVPHSFNTLIKSIEFNTSVWVEENSLLYISAGYVKYYYFNNETNEFERIASSFSIKGDFAYIFDTSREIYKSVSEGIDYFFNGTQITLDHMHKLNTLSNEYNVVYPEITEVYREKGYVKVNIESFNIKGSAILDELLLDTHVFDAKVITHGIDIFRTYEYCEPSTFVINVNNVVLQLVDNVFTSYSKNIIRLSNIPAITIDKELKIVCRTVTTDQKTVDNIIKYIHNEVTCHLNNIKEYKSQTLTIGNIFKYVSDHTTSEVDHSFDCTQLVDLLINDRLVNLSELLNKIITTYNRPL